MKLYQTSHLGYFVSEIDALESPLEPGVFLIPRGCVQDAPPAVDDQHRARFNWDTMLWEVEVIPVPEPEPEPEPIPDPMQGDGSDA